MTANLTVQVEGLKEVQKYLKKIGAVEQSKELRTGLREAAKLVGQDARTRVPVKTGRARGSIGWTVNLDGAYVLGGKKQVPYYGWLDFGSRTPVKGRPRSVGPWKKSGAGPFRGRFIYAAIADNEDKIVEMVLDALLALEGNGPP